MNTYLGRSALLLILLTAAPATARAPPSKQGSATAAQIPRLQDIHLGREPADWGKQGLRLPVLAGSGPILPDGKQFSAVARVGWNDDGVVAQVEVQDATPWEAADLDHLHQGDSVELLVAASEDHKAVLQVVASPGRGNHSGVRQKLFDYRTRKRRLEGVATGQASAHKTATGYVVDLMLPWKNFGMSPAVGQRLHVRVTINDGVAEESKRRSRLYWLDPQQAYDFFELPPVQLALKPAGASTLQAWGAYKDLARTHVNVMALPEQHGARVEVLDGRSSLAKGKLVREATRSVARLDFPVPPPGQSHGPLTVTINGKAKAQVALPDLQAEREATFKLGSGDFGGHPPDSIPKWAVPEFESVFTGDTFPAFGYPDPARIRKVAGDVTIKTTFYDAAGKVVQRPSAPGRYGAVVAVNATHAKGFTAYHTLFREPAGTAPQLEPGARGNAPLRAAMMETKRNDVSAWDVAKLDEDWWHALRKKLGMEIRYESFVRTPSGYDTGRNKRWPVLFFLHGSGGGDELKHVQTSGPQEAAARENFPFITVSLRSPGGWRPPAVHDVMDEVQSKYQVDVNRVYLTGFSMGAIGTWDVAFDQPTRFAAIAPIGGRRGHPEHATRLRHLPVWVFNGADDGSTTAADARVAVEALKKAGGQVKYTEIPGAGHTDSHDLTYRGTELYDWLLQHKRANR